MIRHYHYSSQLRKYIIGFANIFTGLQVKTGLDSCGVSAFVDVPVRYGSSDRVVAAIAASSTQNKQYSLPIMSCYLTGLELAPERMHGVNQSDRRSYLEQGGIFPQDVKIIERLMPIPYNMNMELSIHASNTEQMYQIAEQILILFDPSLQIQFNDAAFDWTKLTMVTLLSIGNEENYPMGAERRNIIWTMSFGMPVWLSGPMAVRNDIISSIRIRMADINNLTLEEVDDDGNLVPFTNTYNETTIGNSIPNTLPVAPPEFNPPEFVPKHYDASLDDCH